MSKAGSATATVLARTVAVAWPSQAHRARKSTRGRVGMTLVMPALLVILGFYLIPALYNIYLSFRHVSLFTMSHGGDSWYGLENFRKLFSNEGLGHLLWNTSFWLTLITVVARLLLGIGLALVLNSVLMRRPVVRVLARSLVVLPWTVPPVAAILIWQFLLQPNYGAANQVLVGMGLASGGGVPWLQQVHTAWVAIETIVVWRELPLVVLMFLAGLQTIPKELFEAARVDGAGWWRETWSITLPSLKPVTYVVTLLTVIWTFNNFVYVWLSTQGGPGNSTDVLGTAIYKLGFVDYDIGASAAAAVLGTVVMFVFAVIYFLKTWRPDDD